MAQARELVDRDLRTFPTTSAGRLFDTAAALLGFTREICFEGQAAIWLEHRARAAPPMEEAAAGYPLPFDGAGAWRRADRVARIAVVESMLRARHGFLAELDHQLHLGDC